MLVHVCGLRLFDIKCLIYHILQSLLSLLRKLFEIICEIDKSNFIIAILIFIIYREMRVKNASDPNDVHWINKFKFEVKYLIYVR